MSDDPVVFLGPTMAHRDAAELLPARYLRPAQCGDVLAAIRLRPPVIVLIDGVFERRPTVWHKEILFAMEAGITVVGASSMGALRAAELDAFGMVGIGAVYEGYRDGRLTDDDEVTIGHADASEEYRPLSTSMVDIRATLDRAVAEIALAPELADAVADAAKQTFYSERSLPAAARSVQRAPGTDPDRIAALDDLVAFARRDGFSQKRADAEAALRAVAADTLDSLPQDRSPQDRDGARPRIGEPTRRSVFFRKRCLEIASAPLPFAADPSAEIGIPEREVHISERTVDSTDRAILSHLARLLALAESLARAEGADRSEPTLRSGGEGPDDFTLGIGAIAGLDEQAAASTRGRVDAVRALVEGESEPAVRWPSILHAVLCTYGVYGSLPHDLRTLDPDVLDGVTDPRFRLFRHIAKLWSTIHTRARERGIEQVRDSPVDCVRGFRSVRGLTDDRIDGWLADNELDGPGLTRVATASALVELVLDNPQLLGPIDQGLDVAWISDAVALADAGPEHRPARTRAVPRRAWTATEALHAAYGFLHDEIIRTDPDIFERMSAPDNDSLATEVNELLLDVNEHVFCAPTDRRRDPMVDELSRGRILDHGCGAGFNTISLSDRGHHVSAVDTNEVKLRFISWAVKRRGTAGHVDHIWSGTYDTVLSINVLDHLPDATELVTDFASSLQPGGRLLAYAHFSDDGVHTSSPEVVTRVFGALSQHFERGDRQPGTDLEHWVRTGRPGTRPRVLLTPIGERTAIGSLRPRLHPDAVINRNGAVALIDGDRWYLGATTLSEAAVQIARACDGARSLDQLIISLVPDGVDAATVDEVVNELWARRFVSMVPATDP